MFQKFIFLSVCLLCASAMSKAQNNNDTSAIAAARAWWHAVTFGDTSKVKSSSTEQLTVTFNNGRHFTRSEFVKQIATHNAAAPVKAEWSHIVQQLPASKTAIITNRIVETVGKMQHVYRFITFLTFINSTWMVAAAQSTRVLELAPPIPISPAGSLSEFVGSFGTPGGLVLTTVLKDSSIVVIEPSGAETKLAAIGPGLFEIPQILSAGNVRFSFTRDKTGKVTHMTRIAHKIMTLPRSD
jgi:hypothetical protein